MCPDISVRTETNARRVAELKEATPLTTDRALINCSALMLGALAAQMKTTVAAVQEA